MDFQPTFNCQLQEQFNQFRALKISLFITLEYQNTGFRNNDRFYMYLRSTVHLLYQESEIPDAMESMNEQIMLRNDNFVQNGSNLQISKIFYVSLAITRFAPLAGSRFKDPEFVDKKEQLPTGKTRTNATSDMQFYLHSIQTKTIHKGCNDIYSISEILVWTPFHIQLSQRTCQ